MCMSVSPMEFKLFAQDFLKSSGIQITERQNYVKI